MVIPALVDAGRDPVLAGAPLRVYVVLVSRLDVMTATTIKADALARELGMRPHTVGRAISMLVERGYLGEGRRDGRMRRLRLHFARIAPDWPQSDRSPA